MAFFVVITAIKLTWDYYYPYEGKVLKIEGRWYDHIPFEFTTWEHLIIETPDGKTIDKLVSMEIRLPNRIETGDYVIKEKVSEILSDLVTKKPIRKSCNNGIHLE